MESRCSRLLFLMFSFWRMGGSETPCFYLPCLPPQILQSVPCGESVRFPLAEWYHRHDELCILPDWLTRYIPDAGDTTVGSSEGTGVADGIVASGVCVSFLSPSILPSVSVLETVRSSGVGVGEYDV